MDTKWKKCKAAAGFLAFFLGVTLTAGGIQNIARRVCVQSYPRFSFGETLDEDYENTAYFRDRISKGLDMFLCMAVGKIPSKFCQQYGEDYDWELYSQMDPFYGEYDAGLYEEYLAGHQEELKKAAQRLHESMMQDENLLYEVCYEGKILYTNKWDLSRNMRKGTLPDEYDFFLSFDGSTVTILKDGRKIDVYGDGYYDDASLWDVLGYENYAADEEMKKATVYMAVRQIPEKYYKVRNVYGYDKAVSEWYRLWQRHIQVREALLTDIAGVFAGIVLFLAYLPLRKSKRQADKAVAGLPGRIWVEVKLAFWMFLAAAAIFWYRRLGAEEVLRRVLLDPGCLLLFWAVYLAVLDCKNNRGMWGRGLCARLLRLYRAKQLRLPPARRMIRRCIPLTCMSLVTGAAFLGITFLQGRPYLFLSALLITGVLWILLFAYVYRQQKLAGELDLLARRIAAVKEGDYSGAGAMAPDSELVQMAGDLEDIRQGLEIAVAQQISSQRMKVELVANVSHDIKTPLTSIISYVQLLKTEEGLEEHVREYIRILDEKSQRLRNMVQDIFEVSKAASGQLTVHMETLDFGKLLRQTLADMDEQIRSSSVTIKEEIPQQEVMIEADGEKLYRVFQNLIQNALKYSLEGSRVHITLSADADAAVASVKNTSRDELDSGKDFTERFVRGDTSRTDGGSGLGLSIARSFTEACGGGFGLEIIADLFVVTVSFKAVKQPDA